jgi:hypothetical protein
MEDILKVLAEKNDLTEELYAQNVRQGAREEYPFPDDELAIIRKTLASVIEALKSLGIELPDLEEFIAYNATIEAIKEYNKGGTSND